MTAFAINFDYRCPFARIAHLHVLDGLAHGADWEVEFVPFSLGQAHAQESGEQVWDRPETDTGLLALQVAMAVRDRHPGAFLAVHRGLFELRHAHSRDLSDRAELAAVLGSCDLDPAQIFSEIDTGDPLATVQAEHERTVSQLSVWGVPTFMVDGEAAFVRLMDPPEGNGDVAVKTVERIVDMLSGWPELNEFKHTSLRR